MVRGSSLIIAALLTGGLASPALAHKMKTFVSVEGNDLVGIVYFSPGGHASDVAVTVTAPDGAVLGRAVTDKSGNFRMSARQGVDNIVTADGGDGHAASFTVAAADIGGTPAPAQAAAPAEPKPAQASAPSPIPADTVEQAVARQIRPLREELNAFQEKVWMHDVLGGLGIIAGIGGVVFGLAERRRGQSVGRSVPRPTERGAS